MSLEIAELLLDKEAVLLRPNDPFTFASGIKSPLYCDNRVLISDLAAREQILDSFLQATEDFSDELHAVVGTATAGIPWAAWLADLLALPLLYVRGAAKAHGKENRIEGRLTKGKTVLLVEDLISTGGSSVSAWQALQDAGYKVHSCLAIFSYQFQSAQKAFEAVQGSYQALSHVEELLQVATEQNVIQPDEEKIVRDWLNKNKDAS
ncbi:MAG: orotate phosphoribosyltransferase [Deltaproteobacteria bacterium]|nr:orotate phosphoribosyltransferase [Deltaproteobacteria bacterium]